MRAAPGSAHSPSRPDARLGYLRAHPTGLAGRAARESGVSELGRRAARNGSRPACRHRARPGFKTNRTQSSGAFTWTEFGALREGNPALSELAGQRYLFARAEGHPLQGELAWQYKFGGDPDMVGKKLLIHGYPLEVTGLGDTPRDCWAPPTMTARLEDGPDLFGPEHPARVEVVGRPAPDVSVHQATATLTTRVRQITAERADAEKAPGAALHSQATAIPLTAEFPTFFTPVLVAFALILLIACADVAAAGYTRIRLYAAGSPGHGSVDRLGPRTQHRGGRIAAAGWNAAKRARGAGQRAAATSLGKKPRPAPQSSSARRPHRSGRTRRWASLCDSLRTRARIATRA